MGRLVWCSALLACLLSCGEADEPEPTKGATSSTGAGAGEGTAATGGGAPPSTGGASGPGDAPNASAQSAAETPPGFDAEDPVEYINQITAALDRGEVVAAWRSLPASYRVEATSVIHAFGERMEAPVWEPVFGVVGKLHTLLESKKDMVMNDEELFSMVSMGMEKDALGTQWDGLANMIGAIATSDMATVDGLRSFDVDAFLSTSGATFAKSVMGFAETADAAMGADMGLSEKLKGTYTLISRDGDTAVVKNGEGEEETVIKVEDAWIPKSMAEEWPTMLADAQKAIDEMDMQTMRGSAVMVSGMVGGMLDPLIAADSPEALKEQVGMIQAQIEGMMSMFGDMGGGLLPGGLGVPGGDGAPSDGG